MGCGVVCGGRSVGGSCRGFGEGWRFVHWVVRGCGMSW